MSNCVSKFRDRIDPDLLFVRTKEMRGANIELSQHEARIEAAKSILADLQNDHNDVIQEVIAKYTGVEQKPVEIEPATEVEIPQFSFAGPRAETANLTTLLDAETRLNNGDNAETVRRETGWFKSPLDGKWKFEIDDSNALLGEGFNELEESSPFTEPVSTPLENVLYHPAAFAAYPELAEVNVVKMAALNDANHAIQGWYDDATNSIYITPYAQNPLSTILHEVQHRIQVGESFAIGGNEDLAWEVLPQEEQQQIVKDQIIQRTDYAEYLAQAANTLIYFAKTQAPLWGSYKEAYRMYAELKDLPSKDTRRKFISAELGRVAKDVRDALGYSPDAPSYIKDVYYRLGGLAREEDTSTDDILRLARETQLQAAEVGQEINQLKRGSEETIRDTLNNLGGLHSLYHRLAGEIEARNVQHRAKMTVEERQATPIEATQDRKSDEAILLFKQDLRDMGYVLSKEAPLPEKITIDGKERWTVNNEGKPIHTTGEGIRNFWNWFGGSKVVDEQGRPLVVYHGTHSDFNTFDIKEFGKAWATSSPEYAKAYAHDIENDALIMPLYMKISNPFDYGFRDSFTDVKINDMADRVISAISNSYDGKKITREKELKQIEEVHRIVKNEAQKNGVKFKPVWKWWSTVNAFDEILKNIGFDGLSSREGNNAEHKAFAVFGQNQIKSAIGNTGAFNPQSNDIRFSRPTQDRFYSQLTKAIENAPDKIFSSANQVRMWLGANADQVGIKRDELYWSGVQDWLGTIEGKVSRQDVVDFLNGNGVVVEDVRLGDTSNTIPAWFIAYKDGPTIGGSYNSKEDALANVENSFRGRKDIEVRQGEGDRAEKMALPTRHESLSLTLPGGTDYQELVLTIPTIQPYNADDVTHFGDVSGGKHIAWIRFDTRLDAEGNKTLFLEEIQSQRGAEGRKKGFKENLTPEQEQAKRAELIKRRNDVFDRFDRGLISLPQRNQELAAYEKEHKALNGVPPAPFISTYKNKSANAKVYIALVLKKAIAHAIDTGHTQIAWTTDVQQAKRNALSKQIDGIAVMRDYGLGKRLISITPKDNARINLYINQDGKVIEDLDGNAETFIGRDLDEVVGNDLAKSILENKSEHKYEGLNLQVGGEWAQSMYGDERGLDAHSKLAMITQAANDIARKMGGRIGVATVTSVPYRDSLLDRTADAEVMKKDGRAWDAPALIITPEMKAKIEAEGMPLFSRPSMAEIQEDWADWSENITNKLAETTDKIFSQKYAFVSVMQIAEMAKKFMPGLKDYVDFMRARRAKIDGELREDQHVVDKWRKLSKDVFNTLNNTMQASSAVDVDVSKRWSGIVNEQGRYRVFSQTKLTVGRRERARQAAGRLGATGFGLRSATFNNPNAAREYYRILGQLDTEQTNNRSRNGYPDENVNRKAEYQRLHNAYLQLPADAKYIYKKANQRHNDQFQQRLKALEDRINESVLDPKVRTRLIAEMRLQFESKSLTWYYAPFARFGSYWFYGKDADGQNRFETFKSAKGRNTRMEEYTGAIIGFGKSLSIEKGSEMGGATDAFVSKVRDIIQAAVPADLAVGLQDDIYQMYLEGLPDVSIRHGSQHRKGTAGYIEDALQAYSHAMHHGAMQLANMTFGRQMERILKDNEAALKLAGFPEKQSAAELNIKAAKLLQNKWAALSQEGALEDHIAEAELSGEDEQAALYTSAMGLLPRFKDIEDYDAAIAHYLDKEINILNLSRFIKPEHRDKASLILDELNLAYKATVAMNSTSMDQIAMAARQTSFIFMLGFSISGGLVNALQTPAVAMPIVSGRYGPKATFAAFNEGYALFAKGISNYWKGIRDVDGNASMTTVLEQMRDAETDSAKKQELQEFTEFIEDRKDDGVVSRTQTFDVIGIGQEGLAYGGKLQELAKNFGWIFHFGERLNREVTLYAAYKLAKENGVSEQAAVKYSVDVTDKSHLEYAPENAARIFRGWPSAIALQFKKYPQGMLFLWGRTAYEASWRAMEEAEAITDVEEREAAIAQVNEARDILKGLFVMQTAMAGIFGLPMVGALEVVLGLLTPKGDDDEPWDPETEARRVLTKLGGEKFATAITQGLWNALTPLNISDRMSLKDIIFREPIKELEGRDAATNYIAQMAGPTGGVIQKLFESGKLLQDGYVLRAAEQATPKFIGDVLKAIRFAKEDARTMDDSLLKDMLPIEVASQLIGFSSSDLEVKYAERGAVKKAEAAITEARQKLTNRAAHSLRRGTAMPLDEIRDWNSRHPTWPITGDSIRQSFRKMLSNDAARGERGYAVNPRLKYLYEKYALEEEE